MQIATAAAGVAAVVVVRNPRWQSSFLLRLKLAAEIGRPSAVAALAGAALQQRMVHGAGVVAAAV